MLVGVGAVVAGAHSNNMDMGNVGAAVINAPQSYLQHTLLAYQRAQEEYADRAGVRFLTMTGQSAKGMYDTFKRFADEVMFSASFIDPYVQNHPMPAERMAALANLVHTQYWDKKDPPELQFRHDMMRAKLYGFMDRPDAVLRRYPPSDTSLPARYARAISTYRFGDMRAALAQIDGLIQAMPNNPYFYELKGQALLEGGHPAEAIAPLRRAVAARARSRPHPDPARPGARRHQRRQDGGRSDPAPARGADQGARIRRRLCAAGDGLWPQERSRRRRPRLGAGRLRARRQQDRAELAARAKTRFPVGSPGWVRADDIVAFNKNAKQNPLRIGQ